MNHEMSEAVISPQPRPVPSVKNTRVVMRGMCFYLDDEEDEA